MRKLAIIAIVCLLAAPAMAWEKFDDKITDTVITKNTRPPKDSVGAMWVGDPMEGLEIADPVQRFYQEANISTVMEEDPFESVPGIHVYDGNDNHVGLLVNFSNAMILIYLLEAESIIKIYSGSGNIKTTYLFFQDDNCTGSPYIGSDEQYTVIQSCGVLYTGRRERPQFTTMQSRMFVQDNVCTCERATRSSYFVPAVVVPAEEIGLYLPIPLPLRFQAWNMPID